MKRKRLKLIRTLRKSINQLNDKVAKDVKLIFGSEDAFGEKHIECMNSIGQGYEEAEIHYGDQVFRAHLFDGIRKGIDVDRVRLSYEVKDSPVLPVGDCKMLYNIMLSLEESVCLILTPVPDNFAPKIWIEGVHTTIPLVQPMHKILNDAFNRLSMSATVIRDRLIHGEGHDYWKSDAALYDDDGDGDELIGT